MKTTDKDQTTQPRIVVFTGAGISAESGIATFRDTDGVWSKHDPEEVASLRGWLRDPGRMIDFWNDVHDRMVTAEPNAAHQALAQLEAGYEVDVITQNVDDLHERGGSSRVLHLHGEITKVRSSENPRLVYDWPGDGLSLGDMCPLGSQLRPHIVFFGEDVPAMREASALAAQADIMIVIGTSLKVYPAALLVDDVRRGVDVYHVNPDLAVADRLHICESATVGVPALVERLLRDV